MENEIRKILESAANTAIATKALELADKLNGDMREAVELGRPKAYRERMYQARRTEMAKTLFDLVEAEADKLQAGIKADAKKWTDAAERNLHARVGKLEMAKTRYDAMSLGELETELESTASQQFIAEDPAIIDALVSTARTRGIDTAVVDAARELLVQKNYNSPWLQSPEAAQSQKEITLYSNRGRDAFNVPIVNLEGKTSSLAFDEILDGSNPTDPQGAYNE